MGGSTPTWLVLQAVTTTEVATQGELAAAIGVRQPTLTHHLDGLERAGLVTRTRDPGNRRVQRIAVTEAGEHLFLRLRRAAAAFEGRLHGRARRRRRRRRSAGCSPSSRRTPSRTDDLLTSDAIGYTL